MSAVVERLPEWVSGRGGDGGAFVQHSFREAQRLQFTLCEMGKHSRIWSGKVTQFDLYEVYPETVQPLVV